MFKGELHLVFGRFQSAGYTHPLSVEQSSFSVLLQNESSAFASFCLNENCVCVCCTEDTCQGKYPGPGFICLAFQKDAMDEQKAAFDLRPCAGPPKAIL